jgi:hypothetical protein
MTVKWLHYWPRGWTRSEFSDSSFVQLFDALSGQMRHCLVAEGSAPSSRHHDLLRRRALPRIADTTHARLRLPELLFARNGRKFLQNRFDKFC